MREYDDEGDEMEFEPRVLTSTDKIRALEDEVVRLKGGGQGRGFDLMKMVENPDSLVRELSLDAKQAKNLKSALIGGGTGFIHNFLSSHIGDIPASMVGAALTSYIARRFIKPL